MLMIGVDYHPSFQQIAFLIEETGECGEQELNNSDGQAEKFYRNLKQRGIWLGHISKQGTSLLRFLLVAAARVHPDWRRRYVHLAMRRHRSIAKVAMGRRLAVRWYWMWQNGCEYSPSLEFGSCAGQLGTGLGVK